MTGKRFKQVNHEIWQYNEWWCSAGGEHCADVIATALNKLCEENEQLKSTNMEYEDALGRLEEENISLKKKIEFYKSDNLDTIEQLERALENNEKCSKTIDAVYKENKKLKEELWEVQTEYIHERYYDNPIREKEWINELEEDFKREYWND